MWGYGPQLKDPKSYVLRVFDYRRISCANNQLTYV
jgi:hypothetical protein